MPKRKHVDWFKMLSDTGDLILSAKFWAFKSKHKYMSNNRCAYYILKSYYSTTSLRYARLIGELPPCHVIIPS